MLTENQLQHYKKDGYVIPDYRLSDNILSAIRMDHDRLVARYPEFKDYCSSVLAYDLSFLNYARIPEILDMVEQVLGQNFALWNSSFFAKPARNGRATPWHQDGEYWPIRPVATCTVWMAIDHANAANGCLQIIRGSHRPKKLLKHRTNLRKDLTLNQELLPNEFNASDAVNLELEAGQISLHDVFLVHGSEANLTEQPRRGMTLRYMPTTSVFNRELAVQQGEKMGYLHHSNRTLYLMRGTDQTGKNDFRMRL